MKTKDKEFIKEILSSDFKQISNPDFTQETLAKIAELENNKASVSYSDDITFLIPVIIYVFMFILLSVISEIFSWPILDQIKNIVNSLEMILSYLVHPVTISILFSFSLLYLFDLFLRRISI